MAKCRLLAMENCELGDRVSDSRLSHLRAQAEQHKAVAARILQHESTGQSLARSFTIATTTPLINIYIQSTPVDSYPDNSDLRLIRMHLKPPFRKTNVISRISHYSYCLIWSLAIRIRWTQLYLFVAG